MKLNSLFTPVCIQELEHNSSNLDIDSLEPSEPSDPSDTNNILLNDYVIYEATDNKISGMIGINSTSDKLAIINNLYIKDIKSDSGIILGKKLIGMVKMITKNALLVTVKKDDQDLIAYYQKLGFGTSTMQIYYDTDTEIILSMSEK
jgi:hypothetical protein